MGQLLRQVRQSDLNTSSFRGGPAQWLWHFAGAIWAVGVQAVPKKRPNLVMTNIAMV